MSQRQDGSGSSSGEWDGLPSPDVLRKYREPKWYMERGAQTEADWYAGLYRSLGIPHRPVHSRAAATAQGAGARVRRAYRPRRCGLCYHEHVFDTRTGLNNHSSKQHGYYYSLKGDCFVPLGGSGVRRHAPRPAATGCCSLGAGFDPRLCGRARCAPGRIRPPYPRSVPPVRYPRGINYPFMAPQATRSGVVTAWRQSRLLDFDVEVVIDTPSTPPPPSGDAIPPMALADLLRREDMVGSPVVAMSPPSALHAMVGIAWDDTAPPVDPPVSELPTPGVADGGASSPLSPATPLPSGTSDWWRIS